MSQQATLFDERQAARGDSHVFVQEAPSEPTQSAETGADPNGPQSSAPEPCAEPSTERVEDHVAQGRMSAGHGELRHLDDERERGGDQGRPGDGSPESERQAERQDQQNVGQDVGEAAVSAHQTEVRLRQCGAVARNERHGGDDQSPGAGRDGGAGQRSSADGRCA